MDSEVWHQKGSFQTYGPALVPLNIKCRTKVSNRRGCKNTPYGGVVFSMHSHVCWLLTDIL